MADPKNGKSGTKNGAQTVNAPQPASTESSASAVSSTQTPMTEPMTQPLPGEPVPAGTTPMPLAATTDTTVRTDQSTGAILEEQSKPIDVPLDDTSDKRPYAERMTHGNTPYGSVDLVVPAHPSTYWPSARAMVDEIRQHAATTHGLASDKLLFEKIVAFLTMQLDDAVLDKSSDGAKTPEERAAMTAAARASREGRTDGQAHAVESNASRMALSDHDQLRAERGQEMNHEPSSVPLSERARTDAESTKLNEPPALPPNVAGTA